jgi:hypothetical protein
MTPTCQKCGRSSTMVMHGDEWVCHGTHPIAENKQKMKIADLIKDNTVAFNRYRKGFLYYTIIFEKEIYEFPVEIEDIGDATFNSVEKAILLMRYIRKAIDEKTLVKL